MANAGGIKAAAGDRSEGRRTRRKFGQSAYIGERAFQWGNVYYTQSSFICICRYPKGATDVQLHINDYNGVDGFEILRHQVFTLQERQQLEILLGGRTI